MYFRQLCQASTCPTQLLLLLLHLCFLLLLRLCFLLLLLLLLRLCLLLLQRRCFLLLQRLCFLLLLLLRLWFLLLLLLLLLRLCFCCCCCCSPLPPPLWGTLVGSHTCPAHGSACQHMPAAHRTQQGAMQCTGEQRDIGHWVNRITAGRAKEPHRGTGLSQAGCNCQLLDPLRCQ
jgi:hypothetical protein